MTLNFEKDKINLSDERFQRGPVWDKKQEQLLIDTILREFDINVYQKYLRTKHKMEVCYKCKK